MRDFGALQGMWANEVYEDASSTCATNASIQQKTSRLLLRHWQGGLWILLILTLASSGEEVTEGLSECETHLSLEHQWDFCCTCEKPSYLDKYIGVIISILQWVYAMYMYYDRPRETRCLSEGKRGDYQNCSVLYCGLKLCTVISTLRWAVLTVLWIGFCHYERNSLRVDLFMFICMYFVCFRFILLCIVSFIFEMSVCWQYGEVT